MNGSGEGQRIFYFWQPLNQLWRHLTWTVFCIMHLEPAPNGIVRLSPVAELCTNHLVISRHLRRHSGGDLDQRLRPLLSFLMAAVFHPFKVLWILCLADFERRVNSEERLQRYCNRLPFVLTPFQIILLRETSKTCWAFDTGKRPVTERVKNNPDVL